MRLVYEGTGIDVRVGDVRTLDDGRKVKVLNVVQPRTPASTGRVGVRNEQTGGTSEYFPNVIGAEWVEREDRQEHA